MIASRHGVKPLLFGGVLLAVAGLGCEAPVPVAKQDEARGPGSEATTVALQVVREYWDRSGSLNLEEVKRARDQFNDVASLINALGTLRRWEIHSWATVSDVVGGSDASVALPVFTEPVCQGNQSESGLLKMQEEKANRECAESKQRAVREHAANLETRIAEINAARLALDLEAETNQTCFWHLVQESTRDSAQALNIILSDGIDEGCGPTPKEIKVIGNARTVVVLIPSIKDRKGGGDPVARAASIRSLLGPQVPVVWARDLNSSWDWLLPLLRS